MVGADERGESATATCHLGQEIWAVAEASSRGSLLVGRARALPAAPHSPPPCRANPLSLPHAAHPLRATPPAHDQQGWPSLPSRSSRPSRSPVAAPLAAACACRWDTASAVAGEGGIHRRKRGQEGGMRACWGREGATVCVQACGGGRPGEGLGLGVGRAGVEANAKPASCPRRPLLDGLHVACTVRALYHRAAGGLPPSPHPPPSPLFFSPSSCAPPPWATLPRCRSVLRVWPPSHRPPRPWLRM